MQLFSFFVKSTFYTTLLFFLFGCEVPKTATTNVISAKIDSLFNSNTTQDFNGLVFISKPEKVLYTKIKGAADFEKEQPLTMNHQFVIGSISKQITAVLILKAYEKSKLRLEDPIRLYFPHLEQLWADTVTIHHLLTHTHGITSMDKALSFKPGEQFQYSQFGYQLLAQILETINKQSFEQISTAFFKQYELSNTTHPKRNKHPFLVKGYTEQVDKSIHFEPNSLENYVPAGSFISTVKDMAKWNNLLHSGNLLKKETVTLMAQKQATRNHPIFEQIDYGYGLTFKENENSIQIGALGFAPGFVSSNFYFPTTKTSVVIFENVARNLNDFKKTFRYHTQILDLVRTAQ